MRGNGLTTEYWKTNRSVSNLHLHGYRINETARIFVKPSKDLYEDLQRCLLLQDCKSSIFKDLQFVHHKKEAAFIFKKSLKDCKGFKPIKCQCCPHIETSQLICCANQLTGFYMRATLIFNGLKNFKLPQRPFKCFSKKN